MVYILGQFCPKSAKGKWKSSCNKNDDQISTRVKSKITTFGTNFWCADFEFSLCRFWTKLSQNVQMEGYLVRSRENEYLIKGKPWYLIHISVHRALGSYPVSLLDLITWLPGLSYRVEAARETRQEKIDYFTPKICFGYPVTHLRAKRARKNSAFYH